MTTNTTPQTKPKFDKTKYCFEYKTQQVLDAINKKLDEDNLTNYHLDVLGFLLTECEHYLKNNIDSIMLNAAESATTGLFNKRSVAAKKAATTKAKNKGVKGAKE